MADPIRDALEVAKAYDALEVMFAGDIRSYVDDFPPALTVALLEAVQAAKVVVEWAPVEVGYPEAELAAALERVTATLGKGQAEETA